MPSDIDYKAMAFARNPRKYGHFRPEIERAIKMEQEESRWKSNHPFRSLDESKKLSRQGWFPFPELSPRENDEIFQARLLGFASCFPAYPTSQVQADKTLKYARDFLRIHLC